jgi:ubiquinone/menaquinone biosynthesis C-methylase UbiE
LEERWARYIEPSGQLGPDYWNYFAGRLVNLAAISEGAAILDVGTYDGNVLFKVMKKAGEHGCGVGIDIYGGGLKDGITKAIECGLGNIVFAQMDAARLGFPSATDDSVLANFVGWDYCFDINSMEFTAPDNRMSEIMRVLSPAVKLVLVFGSNRVILID